MIMDLCKTELCTGCAACANSCPKQCIQMVADGEGFLRPTVDAGQCVSCGACQKACPILQPKVCNDETVAYAAIHKDENIRMKSTSGGVFSLLGQWIFNHNGVVIGAAYADDFSVEHRCAQSMAELSSLRTAKYAQSRIGNTYQKVKQLLADGRYVLFSGTPCQVAGLRTFLGKDYERLILVDLICHGVPSPAVWSRYIDYRSKTDSSGAAPTSVNLRSKETGWPGYSVRFDYENGIHYSARNSEDPFMRCFIGDFCLRPSCYSCKFKGISRSSDFTLGDYWGVWNQLPEYNDGKGTSIVLVHSAKGRKIWSETEAQIQSQKIDIAHCMDENTSAIQSSKTPAIRSLFMQRYLEEDFNALIEELLPPLPAEHTASFFRRVYQKIRRFLGNLCFNLFIRNH